MESIKDIFINGIKNAFPNRFTILEDKISFGLENGYSAELTSNVPLYHTKQPDKYGSATCIVYKNTIYIKSGVMNDIIKLLNLIR